jgi:eukaryotic-like serine/threonine-protein kinase
MSRPLPPDLSAALASGELPGTEYRLEQEIGRGGMGVVVSARRRDGTRAAVKFALTPDDRLNTHVQRFAHEARLMSLLPAGRTPSVFDTGELPSGRPWIAMEYLEGESVRHALQRRGRFELTEAVDVVLEACVPLSVAHSMGIVHRDLKPSNLFLRTPIEGLPVTVVLDFGIAKVLEREADEESLTGTFQVLGSLPYISPEQLRAAAAATPRSDIWSLGVVLYELVSGQCAFARDTPADTCAAVLRERPTSLKKLGIAVPTELEQTLNACLSVDPAARPRSVSELARLLMPVSGPRGRAAVASLTESIVSTSTGNVTLDHTRTAGTHAFARPAVKVAVFAALGLALLIAVVSGRKSARALAPGASGALTVQAERSASASASRTLDASRAAASEGVAPVTTEAAGTSTTEARAQPTIARRAQVSRRAPLLESSAMPKPSAAPPAKPGVSAACPDLYCSRY